jgi:hypothetical protein
VFNTISKKRSKPKRKRSRKVTEADIAHSLNFERFCKYYIISFLMLSQWYVPPNNNKRLITLVNFTPWYLTPAKFTLCLADWKVESIIITSFALSYRVVIAFPPMSRSLSNIFLKKWLELRDISLLNINI